MMLLYWILGPLLLDLVVVTPLIKKHYRGYLPGERAAARHERLGIRRDV